MSTKTPNYNLHQWVPEDHFSRLDFNEDFAKIDAGIHGAKTAADRASSLVQGVEDRVMAALAPVNYNVYNLMLQNYYDGKRTDYKKAMLFDGFLDAYGFERIVGGGYDRTNHCLSLNAPVEAGDLTYRGVGFDDTPGTLAYQRFLCSRCGRLNNVYLRGGDQGSNSKVATLQVNIVAWDRVNNRPTDQVLATSSILTLNPVPYPKDTQLNFPITCNLEAGYYGIRVLLLSCTQGGMGLAMGGSKTEPPAYNGSKGQLSYAIAYSVDITPTTTTTGTLYSKAQTAGVPFGKARAYIRHGGGSVALSLKTGGVLHPMTLENTRSTINISGGGCQETSFYLDLGAPAIRDPITFQLTYSGVVYDYGVTLL